MMAILGWLQLGGIIAVVGASGGAVASAGLSKWFASELEDIEPAARLKLLSGLLLLPAVTATAALGVVFAPSILDALGLVRDHCHSHPGHHAFHACFVHSQPPAPSGFLSAGLLAGFGYLAWSWSQTLGELLRVRGRLRAIRDCGSVDQSDGVFHIDAPTPLAMTVGLLSPTVYVTGGLRSILSESQYRAVVSHERAHAERFHSLIQLVGRCCRPLHLGYTGHFLVTEVELACEQICDRAAADSVGDELSVAEAILTMERQAGAMPDTALGFGGSAIERRVRAMLEADWRMPNWGMIVGIAVLSVAGIAGHYDRLHHAIETWLGIIV